MSLPRCFGVCPSRCRTVAQAGSGTSGWSTVLSVLQDGVGGRIFFEAPEPDAPQTSPSGGPAAEGTSGHQADRSRRRYRGRVPFATADLVGTTGRDLRLGDHVEFKIATERRTGEQRAVQARTDGRPCINERCRRVKCLPWHLPETAYLNTFILLMVHENNRFTDGKSKQAFHVDAQHTLGYVNLACRSVPCHQHRL